MIKFLTIMSVFKNWSR